MEHDTYEDRFRYLALGGGVADLTFGAQRYMNQQFYRSNAWKSARRVVINRDEGCDLAVPGYDIHHGIEVHHMNPITMDDLEDFNPDILDPEFLITVTHITHNAIHYGDERQAPRQFEERELGDTKLW